MFSKGAVNNSQDFKRELAMLSIIRHPLVLHCYGGSTKPGEEFIVTELMEASVYDLLHDEKYELDMEMKLDFAIMTVRYLFTRCTVCSSNQLSFVCRLVAWHSCMVQD